MKQFNITILGSDARQYNITVRSEYQISAMLDELPTYIYQLIGDKLILQSDSAFAVLQKSFYVDELKFLLVGSDANPLKISLESGDDHFVLQELFLKTLIMLLTGSSEASRMVIRESPTLLSSTALLGRVSLSTTLSSSSMTPSKGFNADGSTKAFLGESYIAPTTYTLLSSVNTALLNTSNVSTWLAKCE